MDTISGEIGIIDEFAYQTNLLSMNAAIEVTDKWLVAKPPFFTQFIRNLRPFRPAHPCAFLLFQGAPFSLYLDLPLQQSMHKLVFQNREPISFTINYPRRAFVPPLLWFQLFPLLILKIDYP